MGCVLPKANGADEFWHRLMAGETMIRKLPESRFSSACYMTSDRSNRDKTYTRFGAYIDDEFYDYLQKKWENPFGALYRMHVQALEATSQVFAPWPTGFPNQRTDCFFGCMHYEESHILTYFDQETPEIQRRLNAMTEPEATHWREQYELFQKTRIFPYKSHREKLLHLSFHMKTLQEQFNFRGSGAIIDAACASSIAAMDLGINRLMAGDADLVLTGGFEAFLTPPGFVAFTSVGAVAPEVCLPFDRRSQGLSLGEGCAFFLLQRLEDALSNGHSVLAVIEGIGGASDGNAASLFSPTIAGQKRAYSQCYQGLDLGRVAYVECHGTGTTLGDAVELHSCGEFFAEHKIPVGSAKAIWGHTRGSAGAVGVLKALSVLNHKVIPPSPYFKDKINGFPGNLHVNISPEKFPETDKPALVGVSSFGFGGINYHIAFGEWRPDPGIHVKCAIKAASKSALVVGYDEADIDGLKDSADWSTFKIPQRTRPYVDLTHLAGLHVTKRALEKARIPLQLIDRNNIVTLSGSPLGLNNSKRLGVAIYYQGMPEIFPDMPAERLKEIMELKERFPNATEDSGAGSLNNVIVGRISNFFDFHGKTYNIDADGLSWSMALKAALYELNAGAELAVVIGFDFRSDSDTGVIEWDKASATILTSPCVAESYGLKVLGVMTLETKCT
jgi:acyl transferase domain-containing protein